MLTLCIVCGFRTSGGALCVNCSEAQEKTMETKIQFCCSFKTEDGMNHPKWISGNGLTKEKAQAWAEQQVKKEDWLSSVNDVYQVNPTD